jgi:DNA-binding transcriptional MerR regulator
MAETYGIADLAREFGVTTRTIRFYEDKGLIEPTRAGQRRVYGPRERVRLRLIMRGKRLGFSLDEIGEIIDLYDVGPGEIAQLRHFIAKIGERRAGLETQRQDIDALLRELDAIEAQCADLLGREETRHGAADG